MKWSRLAAVMVKVINELIFAKFVEKRGGLGSPRPRRHYDNKKDLKEIYFEVVNCVHVTQGRSQCWTAANTITNHLGFINVIMSVLTCQLLVS